MGCSQTAVVIHLLRCQIYLFAGLPPLAFYHLVFINSSSNDLWGRCLVLGTALGAVGPMVNETDPYLPEVINVHSSGAADDKQTNKKSACHSGWWSVFWEK